MSMGKRWCQATVVLQRPCWGFYVPLRKLVQARDRWFEWWEMCVERGDW